MSHCLVKLSPSNPTSLACYFCMHPGKPASFVSVCYAAVDNLGAPTGHTGWYKSYAPVYLGRVYALNLVGLLLFRPGNFSSYYCYTVFFSGINCSSLFFSVYLISKFVQNMTHSLSYSHLI